MLRRLASGRSLEGNKFYFHSYLAAGLASLARGRVAGLCPFRGAILAFCLLSL